MRNFQRTAPLRKTLVMTQAVRQHPGPGASSLWCIKETPLFKSITVGNPWSMQKPVHIAQPNGRIKPGKKKINVTDIATASTSWQYTVRERVSQSELVSWINSHSSPGVWSTIASTECLAKRNGTRFIMNLTFDICKNPGNTGAHKLPTNQLQLCGSS